MNWGRKTKKKDSEEFNLKEELKKLCKSCDQTKRQQIGPIKNKLQKIEEEKLSGAKTRGRIQWETEGEKCTKFFFNLEKKRTEQTSRSENW